eukprot:GEMP01082758.1.p1 GENE.GEMP01082758.1~~GEMP01082758.1.p1  ORF type:complete len:131 (+),score=1.47 GEMP01082758.1:538-930(+)
MPGHIPCYVLIGSSIFFLCYLLSGWGANSKTRRCPRRKTAADKKTGEFFVGYLIVEKTLYTLSNIIIHVFFYQIHTKKYTGKWGNAYSDRFFVNIIIHSKHRLFCLRRGPGVLGRFFLLFVSETHTGQIG